MEGIFSYFKNPWVIAAGVGIGALLLLTGKGGSAPDQSSGGGGSPDYSAALASASMQLVGMQAQIGADLQKARIAGDAQLTALAASGLVNMANLGTQLAVENAHTMEGVTNSTIAASFAMEMDRQGNASRIAMMKLLGDDTNNDNKHKVPKDSAFHPMVPLNVSMWRSANTSGDGPFHKGHYEMKDKTHYVWKWD